MIISKNINIKPPKIIWDKKSGGVKIADMVKINIIITFLFFSRKFTEKKLNFKSIIKINGNCIKIPIEIDKKRKFFKYSLIFK